MASDKDLQIDFMAGAMKEYNDYSTGQKTWRDLAEVAYIAYRYFKEFELVLRGTDADISSGADVSGSRPSS